MKLRIYLEVPCQKHYSIKMATQSKILKRVCTIAFVKPHIKSNAIAFCQKKEIICRYINIVKIIKREYRYLQGRDQSNKRDDLYYVKKSAKLEMLHFKNSETILVTCFYVKIALNMFK